MWYFNWNLWYKNRCFTLIYCKGFPKEPAAHIALKAAREWLEEYHDRVDRVIFCMFTDDEEDVYETLLPTVSFFKVIFGLFFKSIFQERRTM